MINANAADITNYLSYGNKESNLTTFNCFCLKGTQSASQDPGVTTNFSPCLDPDLLDLSYKQSFPGWHMKRFETKLELWGNSQISPDQRGKYMHINDCDDS